MKEDLANMQRNLALLIAFEVKYGRCKLPTVLVHSIHWDSAHPIIDFYSHDFKRITEILGHREWRQLPNTDSAWDIATMIDGVEVRCGHFETVKDEATYPTMKETTEV